jgi:hypothetical protein
MRKRGSADELISHVTDGPLLPRRKSFAHGSVDQRMTQLRRPQTRDQPDLWAVGPGAAEAALGDRPGGGSGVSGRRYHTFIMSGYPLEATLRRAGVPLRIAQRAIATPLQRQHGPFSETIGNEYQPMKSQS